MNSPQFWAIITLIAFAGWAATLVFLMKALLPMSNAMKVLVNVDNIIDDKVYSLVQRILRREEGKNVPVQTQRKGQKPEESNPVDTLRNLFGEAPLEPIGEQPDDSAVPIEE